MAFEQRAEGQRACPLPSRWVPVFSYAAVGDAYQPSKVACRESLLGAYWHTEIPFVWRVSLPPEAKLTNPCLAQDSI